MSGKRQAWLGRLNEQLPPKILWARSFSEYWLRNMHHDVPTVLSCWFTPLTWIITSWYKLYIYIVVYTYIYICNHIEDVFFLSSWQCPSSFIMFSRFFITSSKYQVGVLSNSGDRPGWKTGSSLAFFVLLYGHFTIFHSLNMIEVGQLKMLQCDVLVFLLWCFFCEEVLLYYFWGS